MEDLSRWLSVLGVLVLAIPVWKANRAAKRGAGLLAAPASPDDNPVFAGVVRSLLARLRPDTWTRVDEVVLGIGYALTLAAQVLPLVT